MAITASQCRAARALLGLSQDELCELTRGEVSRSTLVYFERGERQPLEENMSEIQKALEKAGVEFIPENGGGAGVRLKKRKK